jgi:guanylate kinase
MNRKPTLVTLTAPSAAGKSYLFNFIRDVARLPCLISTTTRAPRAGEVEGVDYFFISEDQSVQMEKDDMFAELAIYRGVRYGVTKEEFSEKLSKGIAFLIVEPSGIDHYVKPALEAGANHKKYFITLDLGTRIKRLSNRYLADLKEAMAFGATGQKVTHAFLDRLEAATTSELDWENMHEWDLILSGYEEPQRNLKIILDDLSIVH